MLVAFINCQKCNAKFVASNEDIGVWFNPDTEETKRFTQCPDCGEWNKVEVNLIDSKR